MGLDLYKDGFFEGEVEILDGGEKREGEGGSGIVFLCIEMEGCFCCFCVCRVPSVRLRLSVSA